MTKVKQSQSRKTGTASVSAKDQKALEGKSFILAEKDGSERTFSKNIWDNLPEDKQGWKEIQEKPDDIAPSAEDQEIIDRYKEAFGEEAEESLDVRVMQRLLSQLEGEQSKVKADPTKKADPVKKADPAKEVEANPAVETVDHIITQEDLDLDPELAKSGKKVGETIQIEQPKGGTE